MLKFINKSGNQVLYPSAMSLTTKDGKHILTHRDLSQTTISASDYELIKEDVEHKVLFAFEGSSQCSCGFEATTREAIEDHIEVNTPEEA